MNEHPSPEFEKELREALSAPDPNPAFVHDLRVTLDLLQKYVLESGFEFHIADSGNQVET